jgi:uncharacterized membrane protein YgdD (TMEM256/DUF423 family)
MNAKMWIIAGAVFGALGVSLGAFAAHGLEDTLKRLVPASTEADVKTTSTEGAVKAAGTSAREAEIQKRFGWFDTAVRYQMYHAFALVLLGILAARGRSAWLTAAGVMFVLGIMLFSGLLFAMTFGGPRILGAIVPIGGLAMILGWLAMAAGAFRVKTDG